MKDDTDAPDRAGPLPDIDLRRAVMDLGPHASFYWNLGMMVKDYLAPFARSVWSTATGVDLPWPAAKFLSILAYQLQHAGTERSSRTLITVPRTPGRALMTLSLLPAWRIHRQVTGRSLLLAARTERLARAFRARHQAVFDVPSMADELRNTLERHLADEEEVCHTPSLARWARVGAPLRTQPLTDLVLCDPLTPADLRDAAACRGLIQWIEAARRQGRTGEADQPSTVLVMENANDSDLPEMLDAAGWTHIDIPDLAQADTDFELSPLKSVTISKSQLVTPRPAAISLARSFKAAGLSPAEIEALLS